MPTLEIVSGQGAGECHELSGEQSVIGRYPFCDVVLPFHTISRQHSRITRSGEDFFIEDLGSLNGTFVNGVKIDKRTQLADADVIQLNEIVLVFHRAAVKPGESTGSTYAAPTMELIRDDATAPQATEVVDAHSVASDAELNIGAVAKLRAVLEITRSLGSSLDVDDVLPKILDSLFGVFPQAHRGYILLKDDAKGDLTPRAMKRHDQSITFGPISRTVVNRVMSEAAAVLISDVDDDESLGGAESVFELEIRSMMCAPLMGPSQVPQGIIHIETSDPVKRFDREDLEVLATIATVAGQAVENARAHHATLLLDRRERELTMARDMQLHFLPQRRPETPGYQFFDYYQAAHEVGGDYYDYISLPDGRLGLALGDVSGKGVSAALLMARLCSETRYCLLSAPSPAEAVQRLDRDVLEPILNGRFVTFVLCVLNPASHELLIVNAGHMAPLCRRAATGEVEKLGAGAKGLPLGFGMRQAYTAAAAKIEPGDLVLMFTDGISEAHDGDEKLYGHVRIQDMLAGGPARPEEMGQTLLEDVARFVKHRPQADDMCLVCFGRV